VDYRTLVSKHATSPEENILGRRLCDLAERVERSFCPASTHFLSTSERAFCEISARHLPCSVEFHGGYSDAERTVAILFPTGDEIAVNGYPFTALTLKHSERPGHRDILGALLGLGLERSVVGDIIISQKESTVFVLNTSVDFLLVNLDKVGKIAATSHISELSEVSIPERNYETLRVSVASPRLDSILAAALRLSRDKAQDLVTKGSVQINHREATSCSKDLKPGDILSIRRHGKMILDSFDGSSRSRRLWVIIKKYI